ncbi:predicted protein, partial [Nematostella vectensis]
MSAERAESVCAVDVIIIGAGVSGLIAANVLTEQDQYIKVLVLEACDHVGGGTYTESDPKYDKSHFFTGGDYVKPNKQRRILNLASDIGLDIAEVAWPETGSRESTMRFCRALNSWNPLEVWDWNHLWARAEMHAGGIPSEAPLVQAANAEDWDRVSVTEYAQRECWTSYSKKRLEELVKDSFEMEPSDMSMLFFLWAIKSSESYQPIARKICHHFGDKLTDRIILSSPVHHVQRNKDNSRIVVTCASDTQYTAEYVIVALSSPSLSLIDFSPPLPMKSSFVPRFPVGTAYKCVSWYEKPFWKKKGFDGMMATDSCPVYCIIVEQEELGCKSAIIGFIVGEEARYWSIRTVTERQQAVSAQYAEFFDSEDAYWPCQYTDTRWTDDKFARGGCPTVLPSQVLSCHG